MACNNSASPVALPIQNNPLTSSGNAVARGIAISVGSSSEQFSMKPAFNQNNTFLAQSVVCNNPTTNYSCIAAHGGLWNADGSTTDKSTNTVDAWNGTRGLDSTPSNGQTLVYFNDDWSFGNNLKVPQVPFYGSTFRSGTAAAAGLALGFNSSFLQGSVSAGVIPSKRYGIWVGSEADSPSDGQIILGGYDQARLASNPTTFPSVDYGPFFLAVSGIQWQAANGTTTSLLTQGAVPFGVSLEPFINYLALPEQVWRNFQAITGGVYSDYWSTLAYATYAVPKGNLIVTLDNGYQTSIPSSELFQYGFTYDNNGKRSTNTTVSLARVQFQSATNQYLPFWGMPFLTMNYIMTNPDNQTFQMGPAVRDNFGPNVVRNLQRFCTVPTTPVVISQPKSNIGAIVGGVVGGVGGLLLILAIIWLVRRRRRRNPPATVPEPEKQNPQYQYPLQAPAYSQNGYGQGHHPGAAEGVALGATAGAGAAAAGTNATTKQQDVNVSELASSQNERYSQPLPMYSQPDSTGYQESHGPASPPTELSAPPQESTTGHGQHAPTEMAATSGPFEMPVERYRD